jgi:hypothetical protein
MKWKAEPTPRAWETRIVEVYAWLPTKVEDHYIWLEYYEQSQFFGRDYQVWIDYNRPRLIK